MRAVEADVAVIGGGPAGSSLATLLRQQGYRVTLLERETFPRPHVGESMLPGVLFALRKTGALERVERAGFTRKYGATYNLGAVARSVDDSLFGDFAGPNVYVPMRPRGV